MNYFETQYARMNNIDPHSEVSIRQWYVDIIPYYDNEVGKLLNGLEYASVLDLGCGIGGLMNYLTSRGFQNVQGVDRSAAQLAICKKYIGQKVVRADAIHFLQTRRRAFDLILAFDIIEHIPKRRIPLMIQAIFRSLRANGKIIIRSPNAGYVFASYPRYIDFSHEFSFTEQSAREVLLNAGFHDVVVTNTTIGKRRRMGLRFAAQVLSWLGNQTPPSVVTPNLIVVGTKS